MVILNSDEINETLSSSNGCPLVCGERMNFTRISDEFILEAVPADPIDDVLRESGFSRFQPICRDPIAEVIKRRVSQLAEINLADYHFHEFSEIIRVNSPPRGTTSLDYVPEAIQIYDMYMKYSLNIYNFPPCPEEDLMLAVYFFLEEKFNVNFRMWECATYKVTDRNERVQEQVGVIFYRVQSVALILKRADIALKESAIKVKPNTNGKLIRLALARRLQLPTR